MKKLFSVCTVCVMTVFLLCGCRSSEAVITGRLVGLASSSVRLERVTGNASSVVDSVSLDSEGRYRIVVSDAPSSPSFYNLVYNGERVPLLLSAGDRLTVNSVGSVLRNYTVSGNEESQLLHEFVQIYVGGSDRMNEILETYTSGSQTAETQKTMMTDYSAEYRSAKRAQLEFIIRNKHNIAAIYALHQRFTGEHNLFSDEGDIVYYRTVAEAVAERYPDSPYLPALNNEIARMDARRALASKIYEADFPEIELQDMYGAVQRLTSLKGKVILLSFWSAGTAEANVLNSELKDIYEKYADDGFQIYQVCVNTPKSVWIESVQAQRLPWLSVYGSAETVSSVLSVYNVQRLPSDYLIDADGNIVGKDLYGSALDLQLSKLIR